jgi:hypothetical protein
MSLAPNFLLGGVLKITYEFNGIIIHEEHFPEKVLRGL